MARCAATERGDAQRMEGETVSARRDWHHAQRYLPRNDDTDDQHDQHDQCDQNDAPEPHALRIVAICTLGFWGVVLTSCVAWGMS